MQYSVRAGSNAARTARAQFYDELAVWSSPHTARHVSCMRALICAHHHPVRSALPKRCLHRHLATSRRTHLQPISHNRKLLRLWVTLLASSLLLTTSAQAQSLSTASSLQSSQQHRQGETASSTSQDCASCEASVEGMLSSLYGWVWGGESEYCRREFPEVRLAQRRCNLVVHSKHRQKLCAGLGRVCGLLHRHSDCQGSHRQACPSSGVTLASGMTVFHGLAGLCPASSAAQGILHTLICILLACRPHHRLQCCPACRGWWPSATCMGTWARLAGLSGSGG